MSFTTTYWATVNTADGTITGTGQTDTDHPIVPPGSLVVSADNHATILAAEADGFQCKLISGVVRLMKLPVPAPVDIESIRNAAYVTIDTEAELARTAFLTPGSGQALEYQQTAADSQRLVDALAVRPVIGAVAARTPPPRAGTAPASAAAINPPSVMTSPAAPVINPADYPWLAAEQAALAAIGLHVTLEQVADAVLATMRAWDRAGAAIKLIRREAKLKVSVADTPAQISAVLGGLSWPAASDLAAPGMIPGL